jgi:hypothetical protein
MAPPAFASRSGIRSTPRSARLASASGVRGPWAPSTTSRGCSIAASSRPIWWCSAAGRKISVFVEKNSSREIARPPGYPTTVPWRAACSQSLCGFSPSSLTMKPAWSPTATVDTPSFASSIAACDPTLPKPSVAIVAPARSKPCSSAHWRITCTIP